LIVASSWVFYLSENRHLTNEFFMPVKPFAIAWGPLKGCDNPKSDVSICVLI